jgi:acylphosphatase
MNSNEGRTRVHVFFSGTVQGVGFRYTVQRCAEGFAVTGWVRNRSDGRVELVAEGLEPELEKFLKKIKESMNGYITSTQCVREASKDEFQQFQIQPTY